MDIWKTPEEQGCVQCNHCNGYGSSLKENGNTCSRCGGTGMVKEVKHGAYKAATDRPRTGKA